MNCNYFSLLYVSTILSSIVWYHRPRIMRESVLEVVLLELLLFVVFDKTKEINLLKNDIWGKL